MTERTTPLYGVRAENRTRGEHPHNHGAALGLDCYPRRTTSHQLLTALKGKVGFRNPWRFSVGAETGRLWLGDVGQDTYEEIDGVVKGRNHGWPLMEGIQCYSPPACDTTGPNLVAPVFAYTHGGGSASTTGSSTCGGRA